MAQARADANGGFWINGVYVRIAAKPSAKAGLARLDRIAAEITAAAAAS